MPASIATRHLDLAIVVAILAATWTWSVQPVGMPTVAGFLAIGQEDAAGAGRLFVLSATALLYASGVVVDRWGDIVALRLGTGLASVAALALAASTNLTGLLLAQAAAGVGAAMIVASTLPWVFASAGRLGIASGAAFAIVLAAPLLAGWLVDDLSWRAIFLVPAAGAGAASALLLRATRGAAAGGSAIRLGRVAEVFGPDAREQDPRLVTPATRPRPLIDVALATAAAVTLVAMRLPADWAHPGAVRAFAYPALFGAILCLAGSAFVGWRAAADGSRRSAALFAPIAAAGLGLVGMLLPPGQWFIVGLGLAAGIRADHASPRRPSPWIGPTIGLLGIAGTALFEAEGRRSELLADLLARIGLGEDSGLLLAASVAILVLSLASFGLGLTMARFVARADWPFAGDGTARVAMAVVSTSFACENLGHAILRACRGW